MGSLFLLMYSYGCCLEASALIFDNEGIAEIWHEAVIEVSFMPAWTLMG